MKLTHEHLDALDEAIDIFDGVADGSDPPKNSYDVDVLAQKKLLNDVRNFVSNLLAAQEVQLP